MRGLSDNADLKHDLHVAPRLRRRLRENARTSSSRNRTAPDVGSITSADTGAVVLPPDSPTNKRSARLDHPS
jgi:hypothetical protein